MCFLAFWVLSLAYALTVTRTFILLYWQRRWCRWLCWWLCRQVMSVFSSSHVSILFKNVCRTTQLLCRTINKIYKELAATLPLEETHLTWVFFLSLQAALETQRVFLEFFHLSPLKVWFFIFSFILETKFALFWPYARQEHNEVVLFVVLFHFSCCS